jgi:putative hemolysin
MSREWGLVIATVALILGNAFFVAAEYALVGTRRARIEGLAKRGNKTAKLLLAALQDLSPYVAGIQIAITLLGMATAVIAEPFITDWLTGSLGPMFPDHFESVFSVLALVLITFFTVVIGELVPKYLTLQQPDKVAMVTVRPLRLLMAAIKPLVWLVQTSGALVLRLMGVKMRAAESEALPKEELLMLVRTGGTEGTLDKTHAELVTRALRLDVLDAQDIMVHRLDIKWLDVELLLSEVVQRLTEIPYSRVPVCRGDIDDVVGIVYLHDVIKNISQPDTPLSRLVRPAVVIPENLSMEKIVATMRDQKTQMLVVMDEYGGTSGIVTLEDVVEEVFGELEDRLESERPPIEQLPSGRISARADVRFDEFVARLGLDIEAEDRTQTLAQLLVEGLARVPKPGDSVETPLGILRVENMARRRITRVSIQLAPGLSAPVEP